MKVGEREGKTEDGGGGKGAEQRKEVEGKGKQK